MKEHSCHECVPMCFRGRARCRALCAVETLCDMCVMMKCFHCMRVHSGTRLMQAVIVSHELAQPEHFDSYLARVLQPLVPIIGFGRAAAAPPAVEPRFAVWHWWKDIRFYSVQHGVCHGMRPCICFAHIRNVRSAYGASIRAAP